MTYIAIVTPEDLDELFRAIYCHSPNQSIVRLKQDMRWKIESDWTLDEVKYYYFQEYGITIVFHHNWKFEQQTYQDARQQDNLFK